MRDLPSVRLGASCKLRLHYADRHYKHHSTRARNPFRVETTSWKQAIPRVNRPTCPVRRLGSVHMQSPYVRARAWLSLWWSCSILPELPFGVHLFGCTLSRLRGPPHSAIAKRNLWVPYVTGTSSKSSSSSLARDGDQLGLLRTRPSRAPASGARRGRR
jgi:hypothetical protein